MNDYLIEFESRDCKDGEHYHCNSSWFGLGYIIVCDCVCHKKKSEASVEKCQLSTDAFDVLRISSSEVPKNAQKDNSQL